MKTNEDSMRALAMIFRLWGRTRRVPVAQAFKLTYTPLMQVLN